MRTERFTFLCTRSERESLALLAKYHHRSQGDLVRLLILEAVDEIVLDKQDAVSGGLGKKTGSAEIYTPSSSEAPYE